MYLVLPEHMPGWVWLKLASSCNKLQATSKRLKRCSHCARHRTTSDDVDDVVRCRCNWTHWFNGAVHILHDIVRHRNDTDAEIKHGSISASLSHDVHRTISDDIVRCGWVVRCRTTSCAVWTPLKARIRSPNRELIKALQQHGMQQRSTPLAGD